MALTDAQRKAVEEVLAALFAATGTNRRRKLADMFRELPDRDAWSHYYDVRSTPLFRVFTKNSQAGRSQ